MQGREEYSEHNKGIIGTIIFHIIVLIILILFGFYTPLPLPGEEGILVNFGTTDQGLGQNEPAPAKPKATTPPAVKKERKQTPPPPQQTTPPVTNTSKAKQEVMTQDYEKTVAIDAGKKKEEEKQKKQEEEQIRKQQEELKRQQELEAERKRLAEAEKRKQEELERQKRAEAERLAREEAERKAQEEAERKRREEEQRKIAEINARTQGAFSKSKQSDYTSGNGTGKSEGVSFPGGNQGSVNGASGAGKYGPGGSGSGTQGSGVSFSLSGRSAKALPKPSYPGDDAGTVVVKVTVDKYGNVTEAIPGARGTTIANKAFWEAARQAALKAKFNAAPDAPAFQQGSITYKFILD